MDTHQKKTYLVYGRGIDPKKLKLGSLFLDPANPLEQSPFIFDLDSEKVETYTGGKQEDTSISLEFTASRGWLASLNLLSLLEGDSSKETSYHLKIQGEKGSRYQLSKPESFLNEVVLKAPGVEDWIKPQISVCRRIYYTKRLMDKAPKIWMLTGIQLIEKGSVQYAHGSTASNALGFTIPIPDPIVGPAAALVGSGTVAAKAEAHSKTDSNTAYNHQDSRVWAAQFMEVNVKVQSEVTSGKDGQSTGKWLKLRRLIDLSKDGVLDDDQAENPPQEFVDPENFLESATATILDEAMCRDLLGVDWDLVNDYLELYAAGQEDDCSKEDAKQDEKQNDGQDAEQNDKKSDHEKPEG